MAPPPLEAALAYAELGWAVFPTVGKTPIKGSRGHLDATTDPETIARWWRECPEWNVAIATGEASGFFVIDIDDRKDGEDSWLDLIREHGEPPTTVEALTGGGGRHLLFTHVEGIRNRAGVRVGVDVRGDGGFVVAPPSVHPQTGRQYCWSVDNHPADVPIAEAPQWLVELVRHRAPSLDLNAAGSQASGWLAAALGPVPEGQRNDTLTRLTGVVGERGRIYNMFSS